MRVLVAWGSTRGGTKGIAEIIAARLAERGHFAVALPAASASDLAAYDAIIVGGSLYANRWHADARRFVSRHLPVLRRVPVWLFSSGPLDASADRDALPPTTEVSVLMERAGALGHATFGGALAKDAKGFPAAAMAQKRAGDWRNPEHVRAWADAIAAALLTARPGAAHEPVGGSLQRLALYGVAGWALCAALMGALQAFTPLWVALTIHGIAAPVIFAVLSVGYFRARGARQPLPTALAFTGIVIVLDAVVVAGAVMHSAAMFASIPGTWLPLALIFAATFATGSVMAMIPSSSRAPAASRS